MVHGVDVAAPERGVRVLVIAGVADTGVVVAVPVGVLLGEMVVTLGVGLMGVKVGRVVGV
jgi:hypothetical protein